MHTVADLDTPAMQCTSTPPPVQVAVAQHVSQHAATACARASAAFSAENVARQHGCICAEGSAPQRTGEQGAVDELEAQLEVRYEILGGLVLDRDLQVLKAGAVRRAKAAAHLRYPWLNLCICSRGRLVCDWRSPAECA
jgi:hypothetical protein